jgi:hypothetical protein
MSRIEFERPNPRYVDWRDKVGGYIIGNVWKCGETFRVSIAKMETALSLEFVFKAAKKQVKGLKL